jgi:predicted amidophosphoribosyltransferase
MPKAPQMKVRKNYRIAPVLAKWVKKRAKKDLKSETEVVEEALTHLKAKYGE